MDEAFFIAGPPRSGTAWLSQAMMFGGEVFCFHEVERDIFDADDMDEVAERMLEKMHQKHHWFVGNVSSGLLAFNQIQSRLVIIHRPWEDVERSLKKARIEWGRPELPYDMEKMKALHENLCAVNPHAMHVNFDDMFTIEGLAQIWKHCCRLIPPPLDNFREIIRHRVTLKSFDYPFTPEEPWGVKLTETANT